MIIEYWVCALPSVWYYVTKIIFRTILVNKFIIQNIIRASDKDYLNIVSGKVQNILFVFLSNANTIHCDRA